MATVNIGNLTFTHRGDYAGGTAYAKNDVVYYATNGNAYIAKQATTGNAPTNATYWSQFAQGSGGIWNAGLSLGTAGQVVKVNSGANALEFGDVSAGAYSFKQLYSNTFSQETHTGTANNAYAFGSSLQITPAASTDIFDVRLQTGIEGQPSTYLGLAIGVNTADSWSSSTGHSSLKISSGEYMFGMGSGHDSDRYQVCQINQYATMAELGMSAGTLYYVRPIGLIHSQAGSFKTGFVSQNGVNFNRFQIMRLGV